MDVLSSGVLAALMGMVGGVVLGLAARLGDFCTLGALESAIYGRDPMRLRLWGVVLGTAILGTHWLAAAGQIDLGATLYHALAWNPLASIVGGLVFGYGMALAGNCGFGAMVRFGGGDLRSLVVVVVIGIFSFVTLAGPLAPLRGIAFPEVSAAGPQGIVHDLSRLLGLPAIIIASLAGVLALAWGLAHRGLRNRPAMVAWGVAAGLAVVWCLAVTTWLADETLQAVSVEGPSFTASVGRTLIFLMTSTAGGISFPVGLVAGVLLGAFIGSVRRGLFRWEACEDPRELGRQVGGAVLMGIGGVVALGCSVGQGLTGFATLAWSGPVTLVAIVLGASAGLHQLIVGYRPD
jgi:uncharacterized membrane protein YedE/YeeE